MACKNLGGILLFVGILALAPLGASNITAVSWIFLTFPSIGFVGMLLSEDRPNLERWEMNYFLYFIYFFKHNLSKVCVSEESPSHIER